MSRTKLAEGEIAERLAGLRSWKREGNAIAKGWEFEDYAHAVLFTNAVAHLAEQHDHHPDVTLSYGGVRVVLSTHDAGGLTRHDFELASAIDGLPLKWYGKPSEG